MTFDFHQYLLSCIVPYEKKICISNFKAAIDIGQVRRVCVESFLLLLMYLKKKNNPPPLPLYNLRCDEIKHYAYLFTSIIEQGGE